MGMHTVMNSYIFILFDSIYFVDFYVSAATQWDATATSETNYR